MLVTMVIVMNLLVESEAEVHKIPFQECYPACVVICKAESVFPKYLTCPFTCTKTCLEHISTIFCVKHNQRF